MFALFQIFSSFLNLYKWLGKYKNSFVLQRFFLQNMHIIAFVCAQHALDYCKIFVFHQFFFHSLYSFIQVFVVVVVGAIILLFFRVRFFTDLDNLNNLCAHKHKCGKTWQLQVIESK